MGKLNTAKTAFTFDDFVLQPIHSDVKSRKDPDISTKIAGESYQIPIMSAPMNSVTEEEMLVALGRLGGIGVLHRYMEIDKQVKIARMASERLLELNPGSDPQKNIFVAVGWSGNSQGRILALSEAGFYNFCIDVANGHNENCIETVKYIRKMIPKSKIMAGNVCSYGGAWKLAEAGADIIRCGVGGGSLCKTRQVTGHGVPQLSAIEDCVRVKEDHFYGFTDKSRVGSRKGFTNITVIADGGIRNSGDIVKALAIGADAVMIGSLLSGSDETPGETFLADGGLFKEYCGMASESGRRKWFDENKSLVVPEGISTKVACKGPVDKIINNLCQSVQTGLSYSGASNIKELREKAIWRRVTGAGYIEGTPHGK